MVKKVINMNIKHGKAIDLGCGAGRNTIYLIKNGWQVLAIDKEDTKKIILSKLNNEEIERLKFSIQNFENIELEPNNLLIANFSIPFCNKDCFYGFWNKITNSILKNGYFVGNFFGLNDSWVKIKNKMVFLTKKQVLDLFKDLFEIIEFSEVEEDGKTVLGKMKHWHIYNIIARKK